jgi:hypothetical protein
MSCEQRFLRPPRLPFRHQGYIVILKAFFRKHKIVCQDFFAWINCLKVVSTGSYLQSIIGQDHLQPQPRGKRLFLKQKICINADKFTYTKTTDQVDHNTKDDTTCGHNQALTRPRTSALCVTPDHLHPEWLREEFR